MNISRILAQRRLDRAWVLYNVALNGTTISAEHLPLTRVALVTQGSTLARFEVRKLSWMKALNEVGCLGHVATELGFDRPCLH